MSITAEQVKAPLGRVERVMFSRDTDAEFTARIDAYVEDAIDQTDNEVAQLWWAFYRAFDAAATLMEVNPAEISVDQAGSKRYDQKQIAAMRKRADSALASYNRAVAGVTTPVSPNQSGNVQSSVVF